VGILLRIPRGCQAKRQYHQVQPFGVPHYR
jgi:hypothetical protein